MKRLLFFVNISLLFIHQISYSQDLSSNNVILKSIINNGQKFLKNENISSVSIGVFKDGNTFTQHFGEIQIGQDNPPNNETIYEVASVTKTMTGYLAAKGIIEGKFNLEDDIRLYLKGVYTNLHYNNRPIRIKHLLTHTSGLPKFLPIAMNGVFENLDKDVPNTYYKLEKTYNKAQFLKDLHTISITSEPGTNYIYSNLGAEIMGYILETVYSKTIDQLLKDGILAQNDMVNTAITLNEAQNQHLIRGRWMNNKDLSPNQLNTLWGTGSGVKMNLLDMMKYVKLQLNTNDPVVSKSHELLFQKGKTFKIAYFWRVSHDKYGISYNHHGGTSGMQNWLFIYPKYNLGISLMTNHSGPKTPNKINKTIKKILKDVIND